MTDTNTEIVRKEWHTYDLAADTRLDKYNLDIEAEEQSSLVGKWLDLLTEAQYILAKEKERLEYKEATLFLKARTGEVPLLGTKPTEATVKAWIRTQPEYRKAQRRKRKADNNVQRLQNARSQLEHKKAMIKIEADLWICGFFARPSINGDIKKELDENRRVQHSKKLEEALIKRHKRKE